MPHIRAEANGLTNTHVKRDAMQEYYLRYTDDSCPLRDDHLNVSVQHLA